MDTPTEFVALTDTLMGLADDLLEHQMTDGEYKILVEGIARIRILYERTHGIQQYHPPPQPIVPLAASHLTLAPEIVETPARDTPVFDAGDILIEFSTSTITDRHTYRDELWAMGLITHGTGITQGTDVVNSDYQIIRSEIHFELSEPHIARHNRNTIKKYSIIVCI
jgi:hypothetical protein